MASQIREVRVLAKTSGSKELKDLAKQFSNTNKNVASLTKGFAGLKNTFGGFLAALGIREVTRASDEFQLFSDRINSFVGSAELGNKVLGDIVNTARDTKTSVSALGDIYNRVALATRDLGLNNQQIIDTVGVLQNTFRLSGATMAEATGATIQFTQGLASGAVRGQELRSVVEANVVLADILAKKFKISAGELIKFGESGKITAGAALKALAESMDEVNNKASKLGQTFGQSTTILLDAFKLKIFEINKVLDVSGSFAKGVNFLIKNMDSLFTLIGSFVSAGILVQLAKQLQNLSVIITTSSLTTLVNPIALATTAIGALTFGVIKLNEYLDQRSDKSKLQQRIKRISDQIKDAENDLKTFTPKVKSFAATTLDKIFGTKSQKELKESRLGALKKQLKDATSELSKLAPVMKKNEKGLKDFEGGIKSLKEQYADATKNFLELAKLNENISDKELAKLSKQVKSVSSEFLEAKKTIVELNAELNKLVELQQPMGIWQSIMLGFQDGVGKTKDGFKTLAEEISGATQNAFGGLESAIFDSLKGSGDAFAKFTQAVLDDLLKIAIRLTITNQLASALGSALNGGGQSTNQNYAVNYQGSGQVAAISYNGNAFNNGNVVPHYNGGIVDSPGAFPMSGGRVGTIAERGPEAIMPLERGTDGKLGVKANTASTIINVINNTPSQVETKESTGPGGARQIEILVSETVKRGVAQGSFDKSFNGRYGLKPRGR